MKTTQLYKKDFNAHLGDKTGKIKKKLSKQKPIRSTKISQEFQLQ